VTKPSDIQKRTILPARALGLQRDLIIDERHVGERRSILALRPALCEMCGGRSPVARLVRNGFGFWACKKCVRSARDEFEQFGTLRGTRLTIKTRTPAQSQNENGALPTPPRSLGVLDSTVELSPYQQKPAPLQRPPDDDSARKTPPRLPPPHSPAVAPLSPNIRPMAPLRQKATPESLGFALDIAEVEDLLQESTIFTVSDRSGAAAVERDEDDMDYGDDSDEITNLYEQLTGVQSYATRGMIQQFDTPPPDETFAVVDAAPRRGDTFDATKHDSFRGKHGSVRSVVFIENEDDIFANLDDGANQEGNVAVEYLDDDDDNDDIVRQ
jgi:hypothetical protein